MEYDAGHCYDDFMSGAINFGNFLILVLLAPSLKMSLTMLVHVKTDRVYTIVMKK